MDDRFQSSFIPKKPLTAHDAVPSRGHNAPNAIFIASAILFIAVLIIAGGLFLYQWHLSRTIVAREDQLKSARSQFEPAKIEELRRFEKRLSSVDELLNSHWASNAFLKELGELTLNNVVFESMEFEFQPPENPTVNNQGAVNVLLSGLATTYETVALQSRVLEDEDYIREANFSDLILDEEGGQVAFEIDTVVEPSRITYANTIEQTQSDVEIEESSSAAEGGEGSPQAGLDSENDIYSEEDLAEVLNELGEDGSSEQAQAVSTDEELPEEESVNQ